MRECEEAHDRGADKHELAIGAIPGKARPPFSLALGGRSGVGDGSLHHSPAAVLGCLGRVSQLPGIRRMRGVRAGLLGVVLQVQAPIPPGRLGAALGTGMAPIRSRRTIRGDGEKELELVDEDAAAELKAGRAWNALHEEARARQSRLAGSLVVAVTGVVVGGVVTGSRGSPKARAVGRRRFRG